jgi:hypothetical protein
MDAINDTAARDAIRELNDIADALARTRDLSGAMCLACEGAGGDANALATLAAVVEENVKEGRSRVEALRGTPIADGDRRATGAPNRIQPLLDEWRRLEATELDGTDAHTDRIAEAQAELVERAVAIEPASLDEARALLELVDVQRRGAGIGNEDATAAAVAACARLLAGGQGVLRE